LKKNGNLIVNISKQIITSCLLILTAFSVSALPAITGTLEMTGGFYAIDADGQKTDDASLAVGIDFDLFGNDMFRVTSGNGAFTGLDGQLGDITDFTFDDFTGSIADFWTISDFSFELTGVTKLPSSDTSSFLALDGIGIISATGYQDTVAKWTFSGDTSGGGVFSWSATSTIPEPGILILLSMGLIGIGIHDRIYARKKLFN
jgi:hypothetical protein